MCGLFNLWWRRYVLQIPKSLPAHEVSMVTSGYLSMMQPSKTHTCVFGWGHTRLHPEDPHYKCRETRLRTPPAGEGASESCHTHTHTQHRQVMKEELQVHQIHTPLWSLLSALRSQGTDVLQAEHVESHRGESSVLMHHVGHLGGQVGAGSCEHFAHICWPRWRLHLLASRRKDEGI